LGGASVVVGRATESGEEEGVEAEATLRDIPVLGIEGVVEEAEEGGRAELEGGGGVDIMGSAATFPPFPLNEEEEPPSPPIGIRVTEEEEEEEEE